MNLSCFYLLHNIRSVILLFIVQIVTLSLHILIKRGISYDFDQKNYMFWKLVNSFKMMK